MANLESKPSSSDDGLVDMWSALFWENQHGPLLFGLLSLHWEQINTVLFLFCCPNPPLNNNYFHLNYSFYSYFRSGKITRLIHYQLPINWCIWGRSWIIHMTYKLYLIIMIRNHLCNKIGVILVFNNLYNHTITKNQKLTLPIDIGSNDSTNFFFISRLYCQWKPFW